MFILCVMKTLKLLPNTDASFVIEALPVTDERSFRVINIKRAGWTNETVEDLITLLPWMLGQVFRKDPEQGKTFTELVTFDLGDIDNMRRIRIVLDAAIGGIDQAMVDEIWNPTPDEPDGEPDDPNAAGGQ